MNRKSAHILTLAALLLVIPSCGNSRDKVGQTDTTDNETSALETHETLKFTSRIRCILEDNSGNFWFGSDAEGVCRYSEDGFTYYSSKDGLPGDQIRKIKQGDSGSIWFETGDGIARFDGDNFETISPEKGSTPIVDYFNKQEKDSEGKVIMSSGHLWFGVGEANGTYYYEGQKLLYLTFPVPAELASEDASIFKNRGFSSYAAYSIFTDRDSNIWFGTSRGGILRFDRKEFVYVNAEKPKGVVRSIFQDADGNVWFANNMIGVCYFDGQEFIDFSEPSGRSGNKDGFPDDFVDLDGLQGLQQDREGNLWFGSFSDGLWRYKDQKLEHFTTKNGLPDNTIGTIYKDRSGNLWFGAGDGKAYQYVDGKFEAFTGQ